MTVSELEELYATVLAGEGRIELRPCMCGGTVRADPAAPAKGVVQHNSTGRHKAWQDAQGLFEWLPREDR